jgi:hypothetical protein
MSKCGDASRSIADLCVFLSLLFVGNLHATEWQEVSRNINLAIYIRFEFCQ